MLLYQPTAAAVSTLFPDNYCPLGCPNTSIIRSMIPLLLPTHHSTPQWIYVVSLDCRRLPSGLHVVSNRRNAMSAVVPTNLTNYASVAVPVIAKQRTGGPAKPEIGDSRTSPTAHSNSLEPQTTPEAHQRVYNGIKGQHQKMPHPRASNHDIPGCRSDFSNRQIFRKSPFFLR